MIRLLRGGEPNMRILVAEDDANQRHIVESLLTKWEYEVLVVKDGAQAWEVFQHENPPYLAVLDWVMPGIDGVTLCRKIRKSIIDLPVYLILLTALADQDNIVRGLDAGANDYITKPFDADELRARVQAGRRVVESQLALADRVRELEEAFVHVKRPQGLLPTCSYCKKVRDDQEYWHEIETYIAEHSELEFTHGVCPECEEKFLKPELEQAKCPGARTASDQTALTSQEILDIKEVSDHLNIPISTLYKLVQERKLPAVKIGKHWRFQRKDIDCLFQPEKR